MIPDGFTSDRELEWLTQKAIKHKAIVEIGCWIGRSTSALSQTLGFVLCVDDWAGTGHGFLPTDISDFSGFPDGGMQHFITNMENKMGKVIPLRMKSQAAALLFPFPCFDMVFIDGDHRYESICEDIAQWSWLLKKDGLLCGHNYEPCWENDVVKAVDELVPDRKLVPLTSLWWTVIS